MTELYYLIGFVVSWIGGIFGTLIILYKILEVILNWIGKRYKTIWIIFEYGYYRKDFKEWVKDKERLNKKLTN